MPRKYTDTVNCGPPPEIEWDKLIDENPTWKKDFDWHKFILNGIPVKERKHRYQKRKTDQIRRFMMLTFCKMVLEDIVKENVQFDFRYEGRVFLSLRIADRDRESYLYTYDIKNNGHDFIPYCITSKNLWGKVHRYFLWRMGSQLKNLMNKEIAAGRVYDPAPKVNFKNKRQYGLQLHVYIAQGRDVPDSETNTRKGAKRKRLDRMVPDRRTRHRRGH